MTMNAHPKGLIPLAASVGDFIRYWGFRRIHGQIWTLIYLSSEPLSGAELTKSLKVSKALISPALKELEAYNLIERVESENDKTKRYRANPDIFGVIQQVLISREREILQRVSAQFGILANAKTSTLDPARLESLGEMIASANTCINGIVQIDSPDTLKFFAKIVCPKK